MAELCSAACVWFVCSGGEFLLAELWFVFAAFSTVFKIQVFRLYTRVCVVFYFVCWFCVSCADIATNKFWLLKETLFFLRKQSSLYSFLL